MALLLLWQLAAEAGFIPPNVLPAPSDVLAAAWRLTLNGELLANIAVSAKRAAIGFAIGGSLAFAFGLLNGVSKIGEKLTDTTFQMVRNIPNLAMVPLVILWFGIEDSARVFLVALGVFFPIYINTFHGIRTADASSSRWAAPTACRNRELFRRVILPGALPSIFVGLRYALGIMWLTLIVAETIAANSGIGYMAMNAREFMQLDVVVLSILLYALLGKLADSIARLLERTTLQWHPAFQTPARTTEMSTTSSCAPARRWPPRRSELSREPSDATSPRAASPSTSGPAKCFGEQPRPARHRPACAGRPFPDDHRQERLRQEHAAAHPGRPRSADRRQGRCSTARRRVAPRRPADVPGAAPAAVGARAGQCRSRARRATPGARRGPSGAATLAAVGLESRASDWPSVLSGGQKQRVALARALASSPHFLALDEPLGALDALTRIEMQGLIERVWREQGFTAVLVTHDVTEAIILGDSVVLIEDGIVKLDLEVDLPGRGGAARPRLRPSKKRSCATCSTTADFLVQTDRSTVVSLSSDTFVRLPRVNGVLHYLKPMSAKPCSYTYELPQGVPQTNAQYEPRTVAIRDARRVADLLSLDDEGVQRVEHESAMRDFDDDDEVKRVYYPEAEKLVAAATGARWVLVFDHTVRKKIYGVADRTPGLPRQPATRVHNDYTERSGPQRVRDLTGEAAEALLRRRFAVINVSAPDPRAALQLAVGAVRCQEHPGRGLRGLRPDVPRPHRRNLRREVQSGTPVALRFGPAARRGAAVEMLREFRARWGCTLHAAQCIRGSLGARRPAGARRASSSGPSLSLRTEPGRGGQSAAAGAAECAHVLR